MISIRIKEGKIEPEHRGIASEFFGQTQDGEYFLSLDKAKKWTGRYRYYWAYFLPSILKQTRFKDQLSGIFTTCEQLHEILKSTFNQQPTHTLEGEAFMTAGSTCLLEDKQFFEYEERIAEYFTSGYHIELLTRSEWAENCKRQKKSFIQQSNSIDNES